MSESMLDTSTVEFGRDIETLGYKITMEHVKLQLMGPSAIQQVKDNLTDLLHEFAKKYYDAGYDRGVDTGVSLQKMVGND